MAGRKLEERLDQVKQLRGAAPSESIDVMLRKALADRSNLVVAEAAKIVGEQRRTLLISEMLAALDRLFDDPVKNDSKCWGKTAIVKALVALDHGESAAFLRASRHVQMEPVWGGQEDAAIHLRANAVLALVQCQDLSRAQVLRLLVDALADPADPVRLEAVRALEQINGEESAVLLRLKAHSGDRRPHVIGQVFDSLLQLEAEKAVAFVARFLESENPEVCDEAALALGNSRLASAVKILMNTWQQARGSEFRSVLLRALSVSRQESALQFLLELVAKGSDRDSTAALDALHLHKDSAEIQKLVEDAKGTRAKARDYI